MMNDETLQLISAETADYERLIADVRAIIAASQSRTLTTINQEMVQTYWRIGERIIQEEQGGAARASYGEQLIERLGRVLSQEYGRGFSATNLRGMRLFYLTFPNQQALSAELSWSHYSTLMRLHDPLQREFYISMASKGRWSKRELDRQIQSMLYERVGLSRQPGKLAGTLPAPGRQLTPPVEAFKDPYILDFLGLKDTFSEKDLEAAIVYNMERFLMELGHDFCFVTRQQQININGEDYYIDLVFYHRSLRCLVLVDLKIGEFKPADVAQMQLYLEWTKRNNKRKGEKDPIGLILCGSRDEQVVELLLANQKRQRVQVSQYLLLNDVEAIKRRLAQISQAYEQLHPEPAPEYKTPPSCAEP